MEMPNVTFDYGPRHGWFRRNWWWFVPLLILLAILGGAIYAVAPMLQLKSSAPYRLAWEQVRKAPEVLQRLGEPISDPTWLPSGSVHSSGQRGDAILGFDIAGPKGRAHVSVQGRQIAARWGLTMLEVTFNDGKRVALDTSGSGGSEAPKFGGAGQEAGGDAPKWQPAGERPAAEPPARPDPDAGRDQAPNWNPPKLPSLENMDKTKQASGGPANPT